jgi:hypothetical protein
MLRETWDAHMVGGGEEFSLSIAYVFVLLWLMFLLLFAVVLFITTTYYPLGFFGTRFVEFDLSL